MKKYILIFLISMSANFTSFAQWVDDPVVNSVVCDLGGEQAVPHIAFDNTGNFYVGFYSSDAGNYDIRLQYYNFSGIAQWANNGILISDKTQNTWITEWDLGVDNNGNCVIAFNDVRDGNANIYAYSISPSGSFRWGADGIQLTSDPQDEYVPSISVTSSNNAIVAWSRPTSSESEIVMQKITPSGTLAWGSAGITFQSGSQSYTGARVLGVDGDNYIMGFYKETGNFPALTRHIYVQKFNGSGNTIWTSDVLVSNANGISAFTNFTIASDNSNGIILAWMDDRNGDNNINASVQRVLSDGSITWPSNGSSCMTSTSNSNQNPQLLGVNGNNETLVSWSKKNSGQTQTAIAGQKFSDTGALLWGNDGIEFIAMSSDVSGVVGGSIFSGTSALIVYDEWVSGSSIYSHIKGIGVDDAGSIIWSPASTLMAGRTTEKVHIVNSDMHNDMLIAVWEEGSSSDIYMQNIYTDGTIGDPPLSTDATLSDLTIDGVTVDGFSPGIFYYQVGIPAGNPLPITGATANDLNAIVNISQTTSVPGTSNVLVTAEDGVTQLTYIIDFHIAGTDATLIDLTVDGTTITGFAPDVFNYDYPVATGMPIPIVGATPADSNAITIITQATALQGSAMVEVTSEDGLTTNTYTINFLYTAGSDATLADLLVSGVTIEGFDPNIFNYTYAVLYPAAAPYVQGIASDSLATVADNQCVNIPGDATIEVTAEDGVTQLTYTVGFYYLGYDATLSDLTVDGITIAGFDPQITYYEYVVADTSSIPVVDGITNDPEATITITQCQQIPGEATLLVIADDGVTEMTYTVYFYTLGSDATLSDLTVDGITVNGFEPLIFNYEVNIPEGSPVPIIHGIPNDSLATTTITQATTVPGEGVIIVLAQDGITEEAYTVVFKLITGINEGSPNKIILYPNPAKDYFEISSGQKVEVIKIVSVEGKTILDNLKNGIEIIDISVLEPGVYFAVVSINHKLISIRFIKN